MSSLPVQNGEDQESASQGQDRPQAPDPGTAPPASSPLPDHPPRHDSRILALALGSLGVVYGDIGTSPLYSIKECFYGIHAVALNETNILGVLSLVFWFLTIVVSVKYIGFILRADNKGEGGIYALLALLPVHRNVNAKRHHPAIVLAGIAGAALLYGDGIITPAISVLSAVEGLEVATKAASHAVLPITCLVLLLLFLFQHRGTAGIGRVFGPIMVVWFAVIGLLGLAEILGHPRILAAVNPFHAYAFFAANRLHGIVVLGSVVLCLTGGEALYADLGHFGRRAIRISWIGLACPALLLNYFGQGALLLGHPELAYNPFYGLVPRALLYPMVALSTVATVIASQALISGVFSLTQQAVQLGYLPRGRVIHTSSEVQGQIYIPHVNYGLMLACLGVVLGFGESSRLAGAYGLAVTATMGITSVLYFVLITEVWHWPRWKAVPLVGIFLAFDLAYCGANLLKIPDGGWFTLAAAAVIVVVMTTWRDGRAELRRRILATQLPLELFMEEVARQHLHRVQGTAVFMSASPTGTPTALLHHLKHNRVLHEKVILLTIQSIDVPMLEDGERLRVDELGEGCYRLFASYGFMETPDVPRIMLLARRAGLATKPETTTYYLGRENLLTSGPSGMSRWRKALFAFMSRNAQVITTYFNLPPGSVVELGVQIQL